MIWANWSFGHGDCPRCDIFGVGGAVQGAASIAGAGLQASAVNRATESQERQANNALNFQKDVYSTQQAQQQPYVQSGGAALGFLNQGLGLNGGGIGQSSLRNDVAYNNPGFQDALINPQFTGQYNNPGDFTQQYQNPDFVAPTNVEQDPGYQFRLNQGLQALQRSQAATGITGGAAATAINDYAQGQASQEYGNAYQRALQTYGANTQNRQNTFNAALQGYAQNQQGRQQAYQDELAGYNANQGNFLNTFNTQLAKYNANTGNALNQYNAAAQNQANSFNRLAALAGIGQTGVQQLGSAGQNAAANIGNLYGQLGNAQSAGAIAGGNAINQGIQGGANAVNNYLLYRQLGLGGSGGLQRTPSTFDLATAD
jgi:hypothetical protein